MALTVVGANHRTAPIEVRELIAYGSDSATELAVQELRARTGAREAVLLSTCNRTELYVVDGKTDPVSPVYDMLSERLGEPSEPYAYVHRDAHAVSHLFRVAAGMDSMMLGEAQIHGQVRRAWEWSQQQSGPVLGRLFQSALTAAGRVRNDTTLARGAASVSSAAVMLARKIFGSLQGRRAMIIGAGDTAELALECLAEEGVRAAMVANRTFERASRLAAQYGALAVNFDDCWDSLHDVDVLICSTSAPHAIVTAERLASGLARRGDRPICILDIAVPRDVDAEVRNLANVYAYDLDDLRAVVAGNLERRRGALPAAERLILSETERFWHWYEAQATVPALTHFRGGMNALRERELDKLLRRLDHLPPADQEAIAHFSRSLMNKFLHSPTTRVRQSAATGDAERALDALRLLFDSEEAPGLPEAEYREALAGPRRGEPRGGEG